MTRTWQLAIVLLTLCIGLASMPANAAVTLLQSRGANATPGGTGLACNGTDITNSFIFNGSLALPAPPAGKFNYIVGATINAQSGSGIQHVFVGADAGSINSPAGNGNGLLVALGAGEASHTIFFPLLVNNVGGVTGFQLNTLTPTLNVTVACTPGTQFQGQFFFWFTQF